MSDKRNAFCTVLGWFHIANISSKVVLSTVNRRPADVTHSRTSAIDRGETGRYDAVE